MQLEEDDLPYRKGSNATVRSEGTGTEYYAKVNISIKHQLSFLKWKKKWSKLPFSITKLT